MVWRLVTPTVTPRRPFTSDKWPRVDHVDHGVDLYVAEHQGAMASAHAEKRAIEIDGRGTTMRPIDGSFVIEACLRGV